MDTTPHKPLSETEQKIFDKILKALNTNNRNYENGKIKPIEWQDQCEYIFKQHPMDTKRFYAEVDRRVKNKL